MKKKKALQADVNVENRGSVWRFWAYTKKARKWVAENAHTEDWQWSGLSFAVDHRMAPGLVDGMREAGLFVVAGVK